MADPLLFALMTEGPFLHNRIIDLSYAAATKLGYAGKGTAKLKVERITREQIAKGEWDNDSAVRKTLLLQLLGYCADTEVQ